MNVQKNEKLLGVVMVMAVLFWGEQCFAQTPDLSLPNFTNSPFLRKFVDSLPGVGAANKNNLNQYIPVAIPDQATYAGSDYYEIELVEYTEQMHSDLPVTGCKLRGYRQTNTSDVTVSVPHYLGPLIIAQKDRPVRIKFTNSLPTGVPGDLFIPVDTTAMGAGAVPQGIVAFKITDGGAGYISPTIAITGGGGSGARATATINNGTGKITNITVTSRGLGYSVPTVTFSGGAPTVSATATVVPQTDGTIITGNITIANGGIGYGSPPTFTVTGGGGSGATGTTTLTSGVVTAVTIVNNGSNYSVPTVTITGGGAGVTDATATATITAGAISLITVTNGGAGYTAPTVTISAPSSGTTATAIATITDGAVTNLTLTGQGAGYTSNPTVTISGGGATTDATATATVNVTGGNFAQNRASIHMHGGFTPWISDGTPHQWTTPAGESTAFTKGVSATDVPDMPAPGEGSLTFFYTNQQSARLMFYHDHAYGMTRLNVYAGEAAGYLLQDPTEQGLVTSGVIPATQIPLIIQDKSFVPDPAYLAATDPLWNVTKWGGKGSLWFPHVYVPNQDPTSPDGANPMGRWDYGPWFWPPMDPSTLLGPLPHPSLVPEAFMDTPIINGTAYPYLVVEPKAYRLRILNACNDRFVNLQLYYVDPTIPAGTPGFGTEVKMVPAIETPGFPSYWPTDARVGGVPDPALVGPDIIQIGTEGGFLPAPVVIPSTPINYEYNRRNIVVLNVSTHGLFMGPAERADVIVDFSSVPPGSKLILYNDSPAPVPASDPRYDYYTGNPDNTFQGGAPSTMPGYGPNTRTIMQIQVAGTPAAPYNLAALQAALPVAYAATQPLPIVPQIAYGAPTDTVVNIADTSITFTPIGTVTPKTFPLQPKAIHELFELNYGRMNAIMAMELPFTNFNTQTTIPFSYTDPTTENIAAGQIQIWKITHNGVDTHPVHFHLVNVQLINRVGWDGAVTMPDPNELGWKETVRMNPLEDCIVALKADTPTLPFVLPNSTRPMDPTEPLGSTKGFSGLGPDGNPVTTTNQMANFGWEYVWHCHILGHEENDMMRPIAVEVPTVVPGIPESVLPPPGTAAHTPSATPGNAQATVSFFPPLTGGGGISTYTVTSSPGGFTATEVASPITVIGLTNNTQYTFTVVATNAAGTGLPTNASNAVTPSAQLPGAPTSVTAVVASATQVTVSFTAPSTGGSNIIDYTVTSNPGSKTATGATSPLTVGGLTSGVTYSFTVRARNAVGTGPASTASNLVTPSAATWPGVPTSVTAARGNAQVTVAFTAPVSTGGTPITSYTAISNPGLVSGSATASPIVVTGLTNGVTYSFTVKATNAFGTGLPSALSNSVIPGTVPDAPVIGTAVAGTGQATVPFTAPVSNGGYAITSYTVLSSPGGLSAIGATSPLTVTGLTNNISYSFTVVATNDIGTSLASVASNSVIPVPMLPGAPTAATAVAGNTQATVSFIEPTTGGGGVTSYTVTSSPGDFSATGATSPIIVTGLSNGTAYTFTVTATNTLGEGPPSIPSNIIIPSTNPGTPVTTASPVAGLYSSALLVTLTANVPATIYYTTDGSTPTKASTIYMAPIQVNVTTTINYFAVDIDGIPEPIKTGTWTIHSTDLVASIKINNGAAYTNTPAVTLTLNATDPMGVSTMQFSNDGTTYTTEEAYATSKAWILSVGDGVKTVYVKFRDGVGNLYDPVTASITLNTEVPGAPTDVIAVAGGAQATVSFTPPVSIGVSPITSYTATSNPGGVTATGAASPLTVTGLTNDITYTFTVTATNAFGTGIASSPSNSVTPTVTVPVAPGGITAIAAEVSSNPPSVILTWFNSSNNEVGYTIQRALNSKFTKELMTFTAAIDETTYTDSTVLAKKRYYYRVQSFNAIGSSDFSKTAKVTAPGQTPVNPENLTFVDSTTNSITMSWTCIATNATGFKIERSVAGGVWKRVAKVKSGIFTCTDKKSLKSGTAYWYRVQAYNKFGSSGFTGEMVGVTK